MGKDIANYIYEKTTRSTLDLDLQGIWINDREFPLSFDLKPRSSLARLGMQL